MECLYCKGPMVEQLMDYVVKRNGLELRLEDIPTWVCERCDATLVEDEIIEAVEDMLEHLDMVTADTEEE